MARDGEGKNVPSATMDEKAIISQLLYTQRVVYVHSTDLNCHMVPPEAPYYAVKKKKRKYLRWVDTGTAQSDDSYQLWLLIIVPTMCKSATQRTINDTMQHCFVCEAF